MSAVWSFIVAHQAVLSGLGVAVLDLVFALSPSASGSGLLHQIYLWLGGKPSAP